MSRFTTVATPPREDESLYAKRPVVILATLLMALSLALSASAAEVLQEEWRAVPNFLRLPEGSELGACSAVAINQHGEVIVFHRGKQPLMVFDARGQFLRAWGDDLIGSAHGCRVDGENHIWVTDIVRHRVLKFDAHGKLLLSLGTGKAGVADDQFNKPTDIAYGTNGEFFVSDGYGNTRVLKFAATGKLLAQWGRPGKGHGEFNLPHAALVDREGRLLIGDRENNRIQLFDQQGQWLATWPGCAPYGLAFDGRGRLYVADARAHQVLRLSAKGDVEQRFGAKGKAPGEFDLPHMLAFDAHGNMYVAEVNGRRVQKFERK